MDILFLNHKITACGVYQYGLRVANILQNSTVNHYKYCEIENYDEYTTYITTYKPNIIMYNYHPATMGWLNHHNIQHCVTNIAIPHECDTRMFDIICSIDPDETETNNIYNIPRPIYENINEIKTIYKIQDNSIEQFINYNDGPDTPIFGSFGFGFTNKGFDKIVDIINQNYNKAIIKLIITLAHYDPNAKNNCEQILQLLEKKNTNKNIKILITHQFFTNEEILIFLSSNTTNIFLYDQMYGRGISSVIDYAMSVNAPFIISDSYMFRHVYSDNICVYKTIIKDAINNSIKLLPIFLEKYSNRNLINKIDNVINIVIKNKLYFKNNTIALTAFYNDVNFVPITNVTTILCKMYTDFEAHNVNTFVVSNDIFTDTCINTVKTLFINIIKHTSLIQLQYIEHSTVNWQDIINVIDKI